MFKKMFPIVSICFLLSSVAAQSSATDPTDISDGRDVQVATNCHFKFALQDSEAVTTVTIGTFCDFSGIAIDRYINHNQTLCTGHLHLTPVAEMALGLDHSTKGSWNKKELVLSSRHIKDTVLSTPVKELFTAESVNMLYDSLSNTRYHVTEESKIKSKIVRKKLPSHLPLKSFLVDSVTLFAETDPNVQVFNVFQGKFAAVEAHFRRIADTNSYKFGIKVKPNHGDLISFSSDEFVLQNAGITHSLLTTDFAEAGEFEFLNELEFFNMGLKATSMEMLIGQLSPMPMMRSLSHNGPYEWQLGRSLPVFDYSGFSADKTLERLCQLTDLMIANQQLVTWATK